MGYQIYAWLDEGQPRLRIVDSESGEVFLSWDFQRTLVGQQPHEVQALFRQLLLLTCRQEIRNTRTYRLNAGIGQLG